MEYQINSFVCKFNELWSLGENTNLSIQSHQGRASLCLELDLGLSSRTHNFSRNSPSRQRRRQSRTENRDKNSTEINANNPGETAAVVTDTAENAGTSATKITEEVINITNAPRANNATENTETGTTNPAETAEVGINTAEKADIPVTNKTGKIIKTTKVPRTENGANNSAEKTEIDTTNHVETTADVINTVKKQIPLQPLLLKK